MKTHCQTPLQEILEEMFVSCQHLGELFERRANGENVAAEIDATNRHIDNLEEAQKRHPDSVWRSLEIVEMSRLGR